MLLQNNAEAPCVNGFVENKTEPFMFPVERVIRMKVFPHNGRYYVRTREIADLLGMKQPFQFTADVREFLGEGCILNGDDTKPFREEYDTNRVTFIAINDLLEYLVSDNTSYLQTYEKGFYTHVIKALQNIVNH